MKHAYIRLLTRDTMLIAELAKWDAVDVRNPEHHIFLLVINRKRASAALA